MKFKVRDLPLAALVFVTMAQQEANAAAAGTVGDAASGLMDDVGNVGKLVVAGAFLGGLGLVGAGLLKLKQAAESNGGQVKYSEGLWRIAVGAGLVAIPAFTGMLAQTFGLGGVASITDAGGASF